MKLANKNRVETRFARSRNFSLAPVSLAFPTLIGPYTRLHPLDPLIRGRLPAPRRRDKYLLFKIPAPVSRGPQDKPLVSRGWSRRSEKARARESPGVRERERRREEQKEGLIINRRQQRRFAGEARGWWTLGVRAQGRWSVQQQQQQPRRSTVRVVYGGVVPGIVV